MYHVTGQMKIFVDRAYSLYISREKEPGGYDAALAPGKAYALVTSQGHPDADRFDRAIRWLSGMTGTGLGVKEVGRIIHTDSHEKPARNDQALLEKALEIGKRW